MDEYFKRLSLDTLFVHAGVDAEPGGPTTASVVQSSAFSYGTAEDIEDVFRGRAAGQVYSRIGNPTNDSLESRLARLEGGVAAIATSSGMAAITTAVLTAVKAGDEILSSSSLFGGTYSLFKDTLSGYGIKTRFFDPTDLDSLRTGINDATRLVFIETIGNPKLDVPDIAVVSRTAREAGIPLMVDSTLTTPFLVRPGELGADIVVHSTSKFINGSGNAIGGAIVDCGSFDWGAGKFPQFGPFVEKYMGFAFLARARRLIHRDMGACAAPMNSFLIASGIETLGLRMERHCMNALALADHLSRRGDVSWVNYPGLTSSSCHELAKRQFGGRFGAVLTLGLGNRERAFRFINGLKLARNAANLGDAKTLVIHPASTIYSDFALDEKAVAGVTEDMVRVSVGIEDARDIIADFGQALDSID